MIHRAIQCGSIPTFALTHTSMFISCGLIDECSEGWRWKAAWLRRKWQSNLKLPVDESHVAEQNVLSFRPCLYGFHFYFNYVILSIQIMCSIANFLLTYLIDFGPPSVDCIRELLDTWISPREWIRYLSIYLLCLQRFLPSPKNSQVGGLKWSMYVYGYDPYTMMGKTPRGKDSETH